MNISSGEFQTISLGIHSELAKLRTAVATRHKHTQGTQKQLQREVALEIARQISNLLPDPVFVTVGNNGSDMCVVAAHNNSNFTNFAFSSSHIFTKFKMPSNFRYN